VTWEKRADIIAIFSSLIKGGVEGDRIELALALLRAFEHVKVKVLVGADLSRDGDESGRVMAYLGDLLSLLAPLTATIVEAKLYKICKYMEFVTALLRFLCSPLVQASDGAQPPLEHGSIDVFTRCLDLLQHMLTQSALHSGYFGSVQDLLQKELWAYPEGLVYKLPPDISQRIERLIPMPVPRDDPAPRFSVFSKGEAKMDQEKPEQKCAAVHIKDHMKLLEGYAYGADGVSKTLQVALGLGSGSWLGNFGIPSSN